MSEGDPLVLDARPIVFERNDLPARFSGFFRAVYLAGALVGCIAGLAGDMGIGTLAFFGPVLGCPLLVVSYVLSVFPRKAMARLEVRPNRDIVIVEDGGRSALPRKDITGALVVLRDDIVCVEVQMSGGDRASCS